MQSSTMSCYTNARYSSAGSSTISSTALVTSLQYILTCCVMDDLLS